VKPCPQCAINYPDALEYCPRDGSKLPGDTRAMYDPLLGSTIDGRYIIESLLGQGGMGFVYAARHAIIDKRVAIKVLRKEAAQDESAAQRFIVEAKAASKIGHQNIVDITDFGVLPDNHAYFVMEFLDGPTLAKIQTDIGRFDALRAISITVQIARGLHAAHQKGIIHRDLKPENVFVLSRDGQDDMIKIVDFGIAKDKAHSKKLTQVGMVLGTPEYMSPEQATGQATDHRVDMYALGCMLYEMLVGDVPFKGDNATKTLTSHVFDTVVPPSVRNPELNIPPALEVVVMKTLSKKPTDRYADMKELMNELDKVEADLRAGRLGPAKPRDPEAMRDTVRSQNPIGGARPRSEDDDEDLKPPRSDLPLYLGIGAAAVVLIGMTIAAVSRGGAKPAVSPVAVSAPAAAVAPTTAPPATEETARKQVEIVLRTLPPGAEIFDGPERLGESPLQLKRPLDNSTLSLTIRHGGYKDVSRDVVLDRDRDVEVVLVPKPKAVASAHRPTAPAPQTAPAAQPHQPKRVSDLRNPFE
jgi:eukaryotic-like serine/threonine-protein kinase